MDVIIGAAAGWTFTKTASRQVCCPRANRTEARIHDASCSRCISATHHSALDWQGASLGLARLPAKVPSAHFLRDWSKAEVTENGGGPVLQIPPSARHNDDTIADMELEGK